MKQFKGHSILIVQAALVFHRFVICGLDYPRLANYVQNLLFEDFSLGYPRILPFFNGSMDNLTIRCQNSYSSLFAVLVFLRT